MNAPIVLFVYRRIEKTRSTVNALKKNILASESDLFIFSDGAKSPLEIAAVTELREYIKTIDGFKSITIIEAEQNIGLSKSIVSGITEIVNKYGKVIALEDDIVTSPYFLKFMNDALKIYENEDKVMSISGYMYPHKKSLPSTFFLNIPLCWGWATWKRAWDKYNDSAEFHIDYLTNNKLWSHFNKFGGKYLERQLRKNKQGVMNTWFIFWHASVFFEKGFCLYPDISFVDNIGFDSSGENKAATNKFYSPIAKEPILVNAQILEENMVAIKTIKNFYFFKRNSYIKKIKQVFSRITN